MTECYFIYNSSFKYTDHVWNTVTAVLPQLTSPFRDQRSYINFQNDSDNYMFTSVILRHVHRGCKCQPKHSNAKLNELNIT